MLVLRPQAPVLFRGVQQGLGAENIRGEEDLRVNNTPVYMRFRRKVNHSVNVIFLEDTVHQRSVPHIPADKAVAGVVFRLFQVFQISGVG